MKYPRHLLTLLLFLLLGVPGAALARQPNVVILLTDDQGTLDANCFGSHDLKTPHIDRLAATGVRFTRAYAHMVCCPARAALLTGRHPQRGGVNFWTQGAMNAKNGINMALSERTLAEELQAAGYRTALFGKWHLGAHPDFGPTRQGFDEFFGIRSGFIDNYRHYFLHQKGFHDLYEGAKEIQAPGQYFPEMMVQRSMAFIEENRDRPFFLYTSFNLPHYPEQPLPQFEELYRDLPDPARRSYAAVISTVDHYIGQITEKLESLGIRDDTIVILLSDNGHSEEITNRIRFDDHNSGLPKDHFYGASGGGNTGKWIGHKAQFLEGGVRTPAILSYPAGLPQGESRDQAVTAMDWFPTVQELCGIEPADDDPPLDGRSVLPLIRNADAGSRHPVLYWGWSQSWAVCEGSWKLIAIHNARSDAHRYTLHNLDEEHPEVKDHAAEQPQIVARLQQLHTAWEKEVTP
ncbi:sulfatase-like hydrolase/transferase [Lignipirellula cremea]|nr:sulfatase-like hydrolase/transferase [Lignipirellula cremea]